MPKDLLEIAKTDLKAVEILYENKLYPQSLFYFQQSVEKTNKCLAMLTGNLEETELKRIGHVPTRIVTSQVASEKEKVRKFIEILSKYPKLRKLRMFRNYNFDKYLRELGKSLLQLQKLEKKKDEIVFIPKRQLQFIITYLEKERKTKLKPITKFKIMKIKKIILQDLASIRELNPAKIDTERQRVEEIDSTDLVNIMKEIQKFLIHFIPTYVSLVYLAIVTLPHSSCTRYPENVIIPNKFYVAKLPIIELLPKFMRIQSACLGDVEELVGLAVSAPRLDAKSDKPFKVYGKVKTKLNFHEG